MKIMYRLNFAYKSNYDDDFKNQEIFSGSIQNLINILNDRYFYDGSNAIIAWHELERMLQCDNCGVFRQHFQVEFLVDEFGDIEDVLCMDCWPKMEPLKSLNEMLYGKREDIKVKQ